MWCQMVTDLRISQDKNPSRKSQWQTRPHGGWMDLTCRVALIPAAWHGAGVQQILTDWHNSYPINSMASQGWFSDGSAIPSRAPGSGNINKRPLYMRLPILSGLDYTSLFPFWNSILLFKRKKQLVFDGLKLSSFNEGSRDADWKDAVQLSLQFRKEWSWDRDLIQIFPPPLPIREHSLGKLCRLGGSGS